MAIFTYDVVVEWIGDRGSGTSSYEAYGRDHTIACDGMPSIAASSDPRFRGTPGRWTPEELFLASISACHELWYLHLCSEAGIVVRSYVDRASGTMTTRGDGGGRFTTVTLRPEIAIEGGDLERAAALHHDAHARCFIANSVNVPVVVEPVCALVTP